jgi:hypothetical protein
MTNAMIFTCSICGEPSTQICSYCTKDACSNHLCERCGRCSDCCECEVPLEERAEPQSSRAEEALTKEAEGEPAETIDAPSTEPDEARAAEQNTIEEPGDDADEHAGEPRSPEGELPETLDENAQQQQPWRPDI